MAWGIRRVRERMPRRHRENSYTASRFPAQLGGACAPATVLSRLTARAGVRTEVASGPPCSQRDVFEELRWDPRVRETEIGIAVKDGVVTLSGFVDSYAQRTAAERAVERISGVKAIAEELQVRLPGTMKRNDTEIAHHALDAMAWDVEVPDDRFRVRVENGWVTLEGDADWQYQR